MLVHFSNRRYCPQSSISVKLVPERDLNAELHLDIVDLLEASDVEVGVHHRHPCRAVHPLKNHNISAPLQINVYPSCHYSFFFFFLIIY